jgi:hypothetical protein
MTQLPHAQDDLTRCTCGSWAIRGLCCPVCGRIASKPYRCGL